ncbi:ATP-binding protein [Paraburkholderia bryophila]|uniref:AAA family ATPase n=1 Tax=Paraburkholderia bryophila TaxID=420952 RepID=UPI0023499214|nr:ATP-binding protein [Paraburkholderia bryophila]WCM21168.1 ATP-binding protein [Paraburkholderia bryophila]
MLEQLRLNEVGPADAMEIDFSERLNIITGDNGLGKSFLLDVAWWALTRSWAARPVVPVMRRKLKARIGFTVKAKTRSVSDDCDFDRVAQSWKRAVGRPAIPGLVIYAQSDGGYSIWDPARNYSNAKQKDTEAERWPSFVFTAQEVWDGLPLNEPKKRCNGLVSDWAAWQREDGEAFAQLSRALSALSPKEGETLEAGKLERLDIDDARQFPTLRMPYGQDVPVVHASAGMRRIIALAYLLVWTWQEHLIASKRRGTKPTRQIVFLIDEIESHLHPKWQRQIFNSVLEVMDALVGKTAATKVQVIAVTHSPLILASLEPTFNPAIDALFDLDLERAPGGKQCVVLRKKVWEKKGTVDRWLTSDIFELKQARSQEAERVIEAVIAAMQSEHVTARKARQLDDQLARVLSDADPLWSRWRFVAERKGWLPPESKGWLPAEKE